MKRFLSPLLDARADLKKANERLHYLEDLIEEVIDPDSGNRELPGEDVVLFLEDQYNKAPWTPDSKKPSRN